MKHRFIKGMSKSIVACATAALLVLTFGCTAPAAETDKGTTDTPATTTPAADTPTKATGTINVISREDGSGTRSAFVELFDVRVEGADGKKVDATTTSAVITNSTSVMMTTVAGDLNSIGYISLGSLNNTVTALQIDGVNATTDNVKNGSYKISRPFNIVTSSKTAVTPEAQDFINFIMSAEGQKVIADDHYIAIDASAAAYSPTAGVSGKVVVAGSSSVSPVMEKLAEAYMALNKDVTIEIQTSDSGTGIKSIIEGICDIGMSSRELKDSETGDGAVATTIAIDGIAVIVNNDNAIGGLTTEQVGKIFLGDITTWEAL